MGGEWTSTTLGELCEDGGSIQTGPFGSQLHASDYVEIGTPSIMPKNIAVEWIDSTEIACVSDEDMERLSKYRVQSGDIVYSRRGDVEKCALIKSREDGWLCGTGCLRVRLGKNSRVTPAFLHAYLSTPESREWISRHAIGATMPNLNTSILSEVPIEIPPPETVDLIDSMWTALNDKIVLNRKMNETLEAMVQALFKSWFVDFDPVIDNALKAGKPIPEELAQKAAARKALGEDRKGLPEGIQKLFPDEFVFCEGFGWVPWGWEVKQWGEIAKLEYGKSLKGYRDSDGIVPVYGTNGPVGFTDIALCDTDGIVIGRKGAYRGVHYVPVPFYVIDTAFYLMPTMSMSKKWAYYEILQFDINSMDSGSAIPSTSRDDFYSLMSIFPPILLQFEFERIVSSDYLKRQSNIAQVGSMIQLRDKILPKLISGELGISDVGRLPEESLLLGPDNTQ